MAEGNGLLGTVDALTICAENVTTLADNQAGMADELTYLLRGEPTARIFYMLEECNITLARLKQTTDTVRTVAKASYDDAVWAQGSMLEHAGQAESVVSIGQTIVAAAHASKEGVQAINEEMFMPFARAIATALAEFDSIKAVFRDTAASVGENAAAIQQAGDGILDIARYYRGL